MIVVIFFGLFCEDFGSHLESWFDHQQNKPSGKPEKPRAKDAHRDSWYEYLRIAYRIEPVGHHYLRTPVL